jgi:DnaJ-class molecular chaperone
MTKINIIRKIAKTPCYCCSGSGKIGRGKCRTCKGTGKYSETHYIISDGKNSIDADTLK